LSAGGAGNVFELGIFRRARAVRRGSLELVLVIEADDVAEVFALFRPGIPPIGGGWFELDFQNFGVVLAPIGRRCLPAGRGSRRWWPADCRPPDRKMPPGS